MFKSVSYDRGYLETLSDSHASAIYDKAMPYLTLISFK